MDDSLTIKVNAAFGAATIIAELMEHFGATQQDFSNRIGVSQKYLSNVLNFKAFISPKIANRIQMVTGTPAQMLLNADVSYKLENLSEDVTTVDPELFLKPYESIEKNETSSMDMNRKSFVEAEAKAMGIIPADMPPFETVDDLVNFLQQA